MNTHNNRKSTGMTLLHHLAARCGKRRNKNPNGIMDITIGDADKIIAEFKQMKFERNEALRLLGLRNIPLGNPVADAGTKVAKKVKEVASTKIDPRWAKVINDLK